MLSHHSHRAIQGFGQPTAAVAEPRRSIWSVKRVCRRIVTVASQPHCIGINRDPTELVGSTPMVGSWAGVQGQTTCEPMRPTTSRFHCLLARIVNDIVMGQLLLEYSQDSISHILCALPANQADDACQCKTWAFSTCCSCWADGQWLNRSMDNEGCLPSHLAALHQ